MRFLTGSIPQDEHRQNALHLKDLLDAYINSKFDQLTCCKKENGFNKARKRESIVKHRVDFSLSFPHLEVVYKE